MPRRLHAALAAVAAAAALGACGEHARPASPRRAPDASRPAARAPVAPVLCGRLTATVTGRVTDPAATELSGLVRSRRTPGLLWAHNDSGDVPRLFALRADGRVARHVAVTGAQAVDWEDLAATRSGDLVVADIGDNDATRRSVDLYRFPEPDAAATATAPAQRRQLRYADGPHDAETLLADPLRGDLVVVTKQLGAGRAYVARGATLRPGPRIPVVLATAGDVSADGRIVVVRGYGQVAVWLRRGREPLTRTLAREPCFSPTSLAREGQGEALALDAHGRSFVTVPEGHPAALRRWAPSAP